MPDETTQLKFGAKAALVGISATVLLGVLVAAYLYSNGEENKQVSDATQKTEVETPFTPLTVEQKSNVLETLEKSTTSVEITSFKQKESVLVKVAKAQDASTSAVLTAEQKLKLLDSFLSQPVGK